MPVDIDSRVASLENALREMANVVAKIAMEPLLDGINDLSKTDLIAATLFLPKPIDPTVWEKASDSDLQQEYQNAFNGLESGWYGQSRVAAGFGHLGIPATPEQLKDFQQTRDEIDLAAVIPATLAMELIAIELRKRSLPVTPLPPSEEGKLP